MFGKESNIRREKDIFSSRSDFASVDSTRLILQQQQPSYTPLSGEATPMWKAQFDLGTLNPLDMLRPHVGKNRQTTKKHIKESINKLEGVAKAVRTGMHMSAGDNARTLQRLGVLTDSGKTVDKLAGKMMEAARKSGGSLGMHPIKFMEWKAQIDSELSHDPSYRDKSPEEKKKIVDDMLRAASHKMQDIDPDLAKQAQKEIDSTAGFVSSDTLKGKYDTYKERRESMLGMIGWSTGEDHWYGTSNDHSKGENEDTARKILALGADIGDPAKAMKDILAYQRYQKDPTGALKRGEITADQVQKMADLVKKHSLTKVFKGLNKKDLPGMATQSLVTASFALGGADTRKALLTKLQARTKETLGDDATDEDIKGVMRRHAKELGLSEDDLASKDALGTLADKLGVDATVTGEGEGITSTGERLDNLGKGSKEVSALKGSVSILDTWPGGCGGDADYCSRHDGECCYYY